MANIEIEGWRREGQREGRGTQRGRKGRGTEREGEREGERGRKRERGLRGRGIKNLVMNVTKKKIKLRYLRFTSFFLIIVEIV